MEKYSISKNPFAHLKFFKDIVGNHLYAFVFLNLILGLLDGIGLAMFVPLIALATGTEAGGADSSIGNFEFVIIALEKAGIEFNLLNALILIMIIFTIKGILTYGRTVYFARVRLKGLSKLRIGLVDDLSLFSYEGYTIVDAGRIQNSILKEIQKVISAMNAYFTTLQNVIMVIVYVSLAVYSNWQFSIFVAIGAVLINFGFIYINKVTKESARNISWIGNDFNGNLLQAMHNFKYLKATSLFNSYSNKLKSNIKIDEGLNLKIAKYTGIAEAFREPSIILILSIIIYVQVGVYGKSFTTIIISLLLFYRALSYLVVLQSSWNSFLTSSAGIESVNSIKALFKQYQEIEVGDKVERIEDINLNEVHLIYGEDAHILKDIKLNIPAKTSIGLVGESGAGKTSLANIICGLIPPTKGEMFVNGNDISKLNLRQLRKRIGYITQEPVIFNDTIYNNVTFWAEKTPENLKKFWEVMETVSLKEFLEELPKQEESGLGNNGVLVSGGQKQRISIARELYKDIDLLILDEATSALDSETENFIKSNIEELQGKFTMVIIAHRLSTIKNVDRVYLMDKGRIVESGTFDELKEKSEQFRSMTELQQV